MLRPGAAEQWAAAAAAAQSARQQQTMQTTLHQTMVQAALQHLTPQQRQQLQSMNLTPQQQQHLHNVPSQQHQPHATAFVTAPGTVCSSYYVQYAVCAAYAVQCTVQCTAYGVQRVARMPCYRVRRVPHAAHRTPVPVNRTSYISQLTYSSHRTAPHRTAPHRTALHSTSPHRIGARIDGRTHGPRLVSAVPGAKTSMPYLICSVLTDKGAAQVPCASAGSQRRTLPSSANSREVRRVQAPSASPTA